MKAFAVIAVLVAVLVTPVVTLIAATVFTVERHIMERERQTCQKLPSENRNARCYYYENHK